MNDYKTLFKYMHKEKDYDDNYYLFVNKDIKQYKRDIKAINNIIDKYINKIDTNKSLYILGNYLFFTYNNIKYYYCMTSYADEENYINDIIKELQEIPNIKDIVYNYGYLD